MDILSGMTLALAVATLGLGVTAAWSIVQTRRIHQKELKSNLLSTIMEWVTDIKKSSLDITVPPLDDRAAALWMVETEKMLKYGMAFSRNEYIRAITSEVFKGELLEDVENTIRALTAFMFVNAKVNSRKHPEDAFRGTALAIIADIEKQVKEGSKTYNELWLEHTERLAECTTRLSIKVAGTIAHLLRS